MVGAAVRPQSVLYRRAVQLPVHGCLGDFLLPAVHLGLRAQQLSGGTRGPGNMVVNARGEVQAQNLRPQALEELRMLSNINTDCDQVLQIILVGQPGLREMLQHPDLHQFAQRIGVEYHLQRLDLEETWQYIRHRLTVAGGDPDLFDTKGCAAIYYYTRGTPRLINVLCDTALVCGYAEQVTRISADLIREVIRDKRMGGIFPLEQDEEMKSGEVYDITTAKEKAK